MNHPRLAGDIKMTIEKFRKDFAFELYLLGNDEIIMAKYERYLKAVAKLRSKFIARLRAAGLEGWERSKFNAALDNLMPDHKDYLFRKDSNCAICGKPIEKISEATIDHITPRYAGGQNHLDNKQLAHMECNIKKDANANKIIKWQNSNLTKLIDSSPDISGPEINGPANAAAPNIPKVVKGYIVPITLDEAGNRLVLLPKTVTLSAMDVMYIGGLRIGRAIVSSRLPSLVKGNSISLPSGRTLMLKRIGLWPT